VASQAFKNSFYFFSRLTRYTTTIRYELLVDPGLAFWPTLSIVMMTNTILLILDLDYY